MFADLAILTSGLCNVNIFINVLNEADLRDGSFFCKRLIIHGNKK
jgi:hypothetical protein